ncbi:retropepsin-like aspartic protease, partial [Sphingobacterium multivorum]|uniref:retropepsin-like aspartic protease n=1 Tax=Sphingobacterium multivorum TaxID=28454 RepID=UPI00289DF843
MKTDNQKKKRHIALATFAIILSFFTMTNVFPQAKIPLIKASSEKAGITDGAYCHVDWKLDPKADPDVYFVNIPTKESTVVFKTDQEELTMMTKPGSMYDFIVLLNGTDSCHVRISAQLPPDLPTMDNSNLFPMRIPFRLIGSRIFLNGTINKKDVPIQFDLGAGTGVVNRNNAKQLDLSFSSFTTVANTDGLNNERTSLGNELHIGPIVWKNVSVTEVGNMKPFEDLIIGNSFFRNHIIEIDYDKMELVIHRDLPTTAKKYT